MIRLPVMGSFFAAGLRLGAVPGSGIAAAWPAKRPRVATRRIASAMVGSPLMCWDSTIRFALEAQDPSRLLGANRPGAAV